MKLAELIPAGAKVRTIGLYQPYATLMLHGKIETRWTKDRVDTNQGNDATRGRTLSPPPFPEGWYVFYSCKKAYSMKEYEFIAGEFADDGKRKFLPDPTHKMNGFILGVGYLHTRRVFTPMMQSDAFVRLTVDPEHTLWALEFSQVHRVDPLPFKGKQGVGFLTAAQQAVITVGAAI